MKKTTFLFSILLVLGGENTVFCSENVHESVTELFDLYEKAQKKEQQCIQQLNNAREGEFKSEFLKVRKSYGLTGAFLGVMIGVIIDVGIANIVGIDNIENTLSTKLCSAGCGIVIASGFRGI